MPATRWFPRTVVPLLLAVLLLPAAATPTPPGIPMSVAVTAGDGSAVVQWVAPDDGGATISGYTVSASPGGVTAEVPGVARSATVTGLTNGVTYRFTVTASNRLGTGTPSAVSDAVTPSPTTAGVAGTVLVREDFATSTGSMEAIAGGAWGVSSGRYVLSDPDDGGEELPNANLAVAGPVVTGDFTLTALGSATATDSPFNDFSIVFGYRNPDSYWFASFSEGNDPNTSGIFVVEGGVRRELADITSPIVAGAVYPVRVERQGSALRVFRSGEQVASVIETASTDGRVGFGSRNDGGTFDDLVATGPAAAPPVDEPKGFFARLWEQFTSLFTT